MAIRFITVSAVLVVLLAGCRQELTIQPVPGCRERLLQIAEQRAEKGDSSAHVYLGWVYATGSGVLADTGHARHHLKAATREENQLAAELLAIVPKTGNEIHADEYVATIRRGVSGGESDAQMIMAFWMAFGEGLPVNRREADRLLEISARQGNTFARRAQGVLR